MSIKDIIFDVPDITHIFLIIRIICIIIIYIIVFINELNDDIDIILSRIFLFLDLVLYTETFGI